METSTEDDDDNTRGYSPEDVKLLTRSSSVISASPPEVKPDHSRCIVHFDIDSFYAQVSDFVRTRLYCIYEILRGEGAHPRIQHLQLRTGA